MNRRSKTRSALFATLLVLIAPAAFADTAVGVKAGTLGVGAEITFDLSESVALRGGVATFDYALDYSAGGIDYDGDLELLDATLVLDWYPATKGFRITAGAGWNDHRLVGRAPLIDLLAGEIDIPQSLLSLLPIELGTLRGEATVDALGPYLGIGFGRATALGSSPWSLSLDLGVVLHGDPEVELTADSPLLDEFPELRPLVDALVAAEERELEAEAEEGNFFPVVSVSIGYRF
ncbi:MAG: hypothetical protein AAF481_07145 [Acidobacteriota bacterium]